MLCVDPPSGSWTRSSVGSEEGLDGSVNVVVGLGL